MSNPTKDNTSIRVHAPPGGHSNNIFGTSEFEQSAANKKRHMQSDIFGSKNDNNNEPAPAPAPVAKKNQNAGNNIFGSDLEEAHSKTETLAGQYKQTQMKSSIFGTDEPTSTRTATNKNKSDIFGTGNNDDQKKGQAAPRQGHRVGYNPINGESYAAKEPVNDKQPEKAPEQQPAAENGNAQTAPPTNDSAPAAAAPANASEKATAQKPDNANNGNDAQKGVHTSVRVFHPPGGKSNGPLW